VWLFFRRERGREFENSWFPSGLAVQSLTTPATRCPPGPFEAFPRPRDHPPLQQAWRSAVTNGLLRSTTSAAPALELGLISTSACQARENEAAKRRNGGRGVAGRPKGQARCRAPR